MKSSRIALGTCSTAPCDPSGAHELRKHAPRCDVPSRFAQGLLAVVVALAAGCNGDGNDDDGSNDGGTEATALTQYAELACAVEAECACSEKGFAGPFIGGASCVQNVMDELELLQTSVMDLQLSFDAACLQEKIDWFEQSQCTPTPRSDTPPVDVACLPGFSNCAIYHGTKTVNEPCTFPALPGDDVTLFAAQQLFSECAPGLFCAKPDGVCAYRCPQGVLGEGEPCVDAATTNQECQSPLVCDGWATGTCVAMPGEGEPCIHYFDMGLDCADGLYCAPDSQCAPELADGATCRWHGDCLSGLCLPDSPTSGTCSAPTIDPGAMTCFLVVE